MGAPVPARSDEAAEPPSPSTAIREPNKTADERAAEVEERPMDVVAPLPADSQAPELGQPRQRALHRPPVPPEPLRGVDLATGDAGRDPAPSARPAAAGRVVRLAGVEHQPRGYPSACAAGPGCPGSARSRPPGPRRPSRPRRWRRIGGSRGARRRARRSGGACSRACRARSGSGRYGGPPFCGQAARVERGPRPVDPAAPAEAVEQAAVHPAPDAGRVPVAQPAPARHAAAAAQLAGQELPRDAGERGPVGHAGPASRGLGWPGRELAPLLPPEVVGKQRLCHTVESTGRRRFC